MVHKEYTLLGVHRVQLFTHSFYIGIHGYKVAHDVGPARWALCDHGQFIAHDVCPRVYSSINYFNYSAN